MTVLRLVDGVLVPQATHGPGRSVTLEITAAMTVTFDPHDLQD